MLRRERRCFLFLVHLLDGGGRKVGGILVSEHAQGDLRRWLLGKQRPSHPLVEEEDQDDKQQNDHHQKEVVRGTERPRTGDGKVAQRPVLDGDLSVGSPPPWRRGNACFPCWGSRRGLRVPSP